MIREYTVNLPSLFLSKGIYWKVIAISQKKREKDEKERENKERKRDFIKDFEPHISTHHKLWIQLQGLIGNPRGSFSPMVPESFTGLVQRKCQGMTKKYLICL